MSNKRSEEEKTPEFLAIGKIVKTHGLRGEVILAPYRIIEDDIREISEVRIVSSGTEKILKVDSARPHKGRYILKFEGLDSIEEGEGLRGEELLIRADVIPRTSAEWLFLDQVKGIEIVDSSGKRIGTLSYIMDSPAHPVFVILTDEGKEMMLPAVDEFIIETDIEGRKLVVSPPDGIFEVYDI